MKHPLPEAFLKKQLELLGTEEYPHFIKSYELPASKGLRVNTLKLTTEQFVHHTDYTSRPIPWCKEGFYYNDSARPGKHPYHAAGLYYIQEPSAMAVVEVLDPKPGEKIIDLAAAPGGKATQIAIKMQNKGLLIANEVHPTRAKTLSENVERLGITNTIVTNEDVQRLAARFPNYFDRILLDAPCSGEGMFRKDEEARAEWSIDAINTCSSRQSELLKAAAHLLKPGGKLVYSTCTFSPEENEQVIEQFLMQHPDWQLDSIPHVHGIMHGNPEWGIHKNQELTKTARLWPHRLNGEGHFIALLVKAGDSEFSTNEAHTKKKKNDTNLQEALILFKRFVEENLHVSQEHFDNQKMTLFGTHLYQIPEYTPSMDRLKVLRAGLHLGEVKKNRFEPSHALALALSIDDFKESLSFNPDSIDLSAYLHGESIPIVSNLKGWIGISVEGFPIGWGKASQGILKNHYPKGLRLKR